MRYRFLGSTTPVAVSAGVATPLQSCVPGARLIGIESFKVETASRDLSHRMMLWRVLEYDADGSTGNANNAVADDARVTASVPTGKVGWTGTGTQVPNGNPRELARGFVHPTERGDVSLTSLLNGEVPEITPGKVGVFVLTPVEAQNVRLIELTVVDR